MTEPTFNTVPILRIFAIDKARAFYCDYLGCSVDWEHRFEPGLPLYMQVSRGDLVLHLTEHHGDTTPGTTVFVSTTGIDQLHEELTGKDYDYLRPGVEMAPWGAKVMELTDPFGNRLRFNETVTDDQSITSQ